MTCPKCGLQSLADQKFCRSCGAPLRMTTQQLVRPRDVSDLTGVSAAGSEGRKPQRMNLVLWGFVMMLIGVAIGVVGKKLLDEDIITVVGVLISLAGIFLVSYPYLFPRRQKSDASVPLSQPQVLDPPHTAEYLPPGNNVDYVPSITERTTTLLENSHVEKPREKKI